MTAAALRSTRSHTYGPATRRRRLGMCLTVRAGDSRSHSQSSCSHHRPTTLANQSVSPTSLHACRLRQLRNGRGLPTESTRVPITREQGHAARSRARVGVRPDLEARARRRPHADMQPEEAGRGWFAAKGRGQGAQQMIYRRQGTLPHTTNAPAPPGIRRADAGRGRPSGRKHGGALPRRKHKQAVGITRAARRGAVDAAGKCLGHKSGGRRGTTGHMQMRPVH